MIFKSLEEINTMKKISFSILIIILVSWQAFGQGHSSKQTIPFLHHEIEGFIGSTHVPKGALDDSGATLILPNIGLNYKYWFDERFAIGWYNNIVALSYEVNSDSHQDLDRYYPITTSIVGIFKPWKHLTLFTGPGLEVDKNKSLFVFRFGVDYGIPLSNDWYLTPRFIFDNLSGDIQAYTLGIGASKRF
jgi:hypothetical protein